MEEELAERLRRWCAYQERCTSQLQEKMRKMDLSDEQVDRFIGLLKEEGFLDDTRFAISFASGKIRIKKWGRIKVRAELSRLRIASSLIETALDSFDREEYDALVIETARKKSALIRENDKYVKTGKLAQFLISKGIEQQQAWQAAKLVVD
ncbi:MAG: regulatory protein [Flavobacteriales bacterium]|jgi:regulatory protein